MNSVDTETARRLLEDLTKEELADIHRGIEEIRAGKAKHFKNIHELLKWLHRDRRD
jgi:hypothetical protein